jgi:hypothetical protein
MNIIPAPSKTIVANVTMETTACTVAMATTGTTQVLSATSSIGAPTFVTPTALETTTPLEPATTLVATTARVESATPRIESTLATIAIHGVRQTPPSHNRLTHLNLSPS